MLNLQMLSKLGIRERMLILLAVCTAGMLVIGAVSLVGTTHLSEVTEQIELAKDGVADVIPPPLNLLEHYMLAHDLEQNPNKAERVANIERMRMLIKDFRERSRFWHEKLAKYPDAIAALTEHDRSAEAFFDLVEKDFLPAVEAGDLTRAERIRDDELEPIYDASQKSTHAIVAFMNKLQNAEMKEFDETHMQVLVLSIGIALLVIALSLGLGFAMLKAIVDRLRVTQEAMARVARGDLTAEVRVEIHDELGRMGESLNALVAGMREAMLGVARSSAAVAHASSELSASVSTLASGTQTQAGALEEAAASLEEITATMKHNADGAQQASQVAGSSRDVAEQGGRVVGSAVNAMSEINARSREIAAIITTIDEIAFQTNLLALNAAVEAARAGEQGRGFAVVASEVRNLAQRSAKAAAEIKALIQDSVRQIDEGTKLVNQSGETLHGIVDSVKHLTTIVAEIASASREQSTGVQQVSTAVSEMDRMTQTAAAQTEELSATAESMSQQARELEAMVARFELGAGHSAAASVHAKPARIVTGTFTKPALKLAAPSHAVSRPAIAASSGGGGEEFEEL